MNPALKTALSYLPLALLMGAVVVRFAMWAAGRRLKKGRR
jgi:hypothetical protein